MNDFTKEELEDILNWGNIYTEFGTCSSYKMDKALMDKIEGMIDDYCDHEKEPRTQYWAEDARLYNKCTKCGKLYE